MRIALLSYRSKTHCGGQGVYVRHLSRGLVDLGHDVEVFSGQPYPDLLDSRVRLTEVPSLDLYREPDPFRVPRPSEIRDSIDPSAMFAGTGPDSLTVTKGESTTIDGTEATAYRITLDVAAMAQVLGRTLSAEELDQVKAAAGGTSMDVVYYLDAQDRPIRTTVTMGTFMTQEMRYSGFGTQSPITAPAAAEVIPASELGL